MSSSNDARKGPQAEAIDGYQIGTEIGKGSFANVYKGVVLKTHTPVAVKSVLRTKLKNKKLLENLEIEIQILKTMAHPHIVALIDCVQSANYFHIIMEYCSLGDLSYFIRKRNQLVKSHPLISQLLIKYPSPENSNGLHRIMVIHFLKQLASALEFLRQRNLVHRDIKPQNLLLCYPAHSKEEFTQNHYVGFYDLPILKVADFGFARFLPNQTLAETLCGSPLYMAPEILGYHKYNAKADLWSVGAVLYEMSIGKPPFRANNHVELLKKIENAHDNISFPETIELDQDIKRVICGLLKLKPIERMSFNEFFNDRLILDDFSEEVNDSQLLDHSSIDENLFISEYLPQNDKIKHSLPIQQQSPRSPKIVKAPDPVVELPKQENQSQPEQQIKPPSETPTKNSLLKQQLENHGSVVEKIETSKPPGIIDSPRASNYSSGSSTKMKGSSNSLKAKSNATELLNERDYVVVEKKSVEVNALADELANLGTNNSNNKVVTTTKSNDRRRRSSSSSQKRPSFGDRRFSISLSPSNALSKAIVLASTKLWGANTYSSKEIPNYVVNDSPSNIPQGFSPSNNIFISETVNNSPAIVGTPNNALITSPTATNNNVNPDSEDFLTNLIVQLESLAAKAHAVNSFAHVKYSQLIPFTPSSLSSAIADDSDDEDPEFLSEKTSHLPPVAVKSISEEGLALYIKTLSLLAKAMNLTSDWWYSSENGAVLKSHYNEGFQGNNNFDSSLTTRLNSLVQWIRNIFNDCLDKADFIRLKLNEANQKLGLGGLDPESNLNSDVIAEKLIFDRALEISRNAAVNELVGEDLLGCELAYSTSIWMLEAILDSNNDGQAGKSSEIEDVRLDQEDKAMVQKFIVSIGNRLNVLRKKIELMSNEGSTNLNK
ncbi:serine/threonine protein kinase [Saccharomycopsis crataegensis]|uniref:Serine/threonine-protein kinase ATG1 n=1 Tax=Saccharomycopsis crataegensis TaxID=43959 RepID=A0AAV5QFS4_9ASCO|nr:serine/threonine protein kinase [Saccharomycopsis crataegensis]